MADEAEKRVAGYYTSVGWEEDGDVTGDARRWEDLRDCARDYVSACRLRLLDHIPPRGDRILDMASGPIQYPEYLRFSEGYDKRYCVDLSERALARAKERIGEHGVFLHGSILDLELEEDFFDCVISLHTIYHIGKEHQEAVVRKLLRSVRPGRPVIVVYSNPDSFMVLARDRWRRLRWRRGEAGGEKAAGSGAGEPPQEGIRPGDPYFFAYPISWWGRFGDVAEVSVFPWRAFSATAQKRLFPGNALGRGLFWVLDRLERRFPRFFARHFQYPMFVLTKR